MNQYRLRLIISCALLSITGTVISLKLLGMLNASPTGDHPWFYASGQLGVQQLSPYRISCRKQLALIQHLEARNGDSYLRDAEGKLVYCSAVNVD